MIDLITARLKSYQPVRLHTRFDQAGILVPVTREPDPHIILTRRSLHLKTHSGQVAFPGGRKEVHDENLLATALRESFEEIALPPEQVEVLGPLSEVVSRYKIAVTPYVGLVPPDLVLCPDPREIDSIFAVPVRFFLEKEPVRYDDLGFEQYRLSVPCWQYESYEIWGMSAVVLMDFFKVVFDRPFGNVA
jgi:8-oxo-dGTP pyrophosphatase MutT (NUDIX family)